MVGGYDSCIGIHNRGPRRRHRPGNHGRPSLVPMAAGARLDIETIDIGEAVYRRGLSAGIGGEAWESLRRTRVFLKAPVTTPQGGGFKSLSDMPTSPDWSTRRQMPGWTSSRPSPSAPSMANPGSPSVRASSGPLPAGARARDTRGPKCQQRARRRVTPARRATTDGPRHKAKSVRSGPGWRDRSRARTGLATMPAPSVLR